MRKIKRKRKDWRNDFDTAPGLTRKRGLRDCSPALFRVESLVSALPFSYDHHPVHSPPISHRHHRRPRRGSAPAQQHGRDQAGGGPSLAHRLLQPSVDQVVLRRHPRCDQSRRLHAHRTPLPDEGRRLHQRQRHARIPRRPQGQDRGPRPQGKHDRPPREDRPAPRRGPRRHSCANRQRPHHGRRVRAHVWRR